MDFDVTPFVYFAGLSVLMKLELATANSSLSSEIEVSSMSFFFVTFKSLWMHCCTTSLRSYCIWQHFSHWEAIQMRFKSLCELIRVIFPCFTLQSRKNLTNKGGDGILKYGIHHFNKRFDRHFQGQYSLYCTWDDFDCCLKGFQYSVYCLWQQH